MTSTNVLLIEEMEAEMEKEFWRKKIGNNF